MKAPLSCAEGKARQNGCLVLPPAEQFRIFWRASNVSGQFTSGGGVRQHRLCFLPGCPRPRFIFTPFTLTPRTMPPHSPIWLQRLPPDLRRRLELAEASAWEARSATHAAQALELVGLLAPRMPFDEAIDRYVDIMGLTGDEAEIVRTRSLALLSESEEAGDLARDRPRPGMGLNWRYATPLGAVRFVRRQIRRNAEEDLWLELAAARAEEALIRTHMRQAIHFCEILEKEAPPPRAVSLFLDRLEIPAARARSIYQRTLAQIAETDLPRRISEEYPAEAIRDPAEEGAVPAAQQD